MIGAEETTRVRYRHNEPEVESERRSVRSSRGAAARQAPSGAGKRLSKAKREERERRQRTIRNRRFGLIAAMVGLVCLACWGLVALYRAPIFVVRHVSISGGRHYSARQIEQIAQVPAGATLVRLPASAIERRLEADPWIAEAHVDRDFPSSLRLVVEERTPAAVVDAGGTSIWVVSSDGRWLGRRTGDQGPGVVIAGVPKVAPRAGTPVKEPEVTNAVKVLEGLSAGLRRSVVSVSAPTVEETALKTKGDVEVFIGRAESMKEKDRIVREILRKQKHVVYINVRVTDRPTWRGLDEGD